MFESVLVSTNIGGSLFTDVSVLYWFLGVQIILLIMILLKKR